MLSPFWSCDPASLPPPAQLSQSVCWAWGHIVSNIPWLVGVSYPAHDTSQLLVKIDSIPAEPRTQCMQRKLLLAGGRRYAHLCEPWPGRMLRVWAWDGNPFCTLEHQGHPPLHPGLWWGRAPAVRSVANPGLTWCGWKSSGSSWCILLVLDMCLLTCLS